MTPLLAVFLLLPLVAPQDEAAARRVLAAFAESQRDTRTISASYVQERTSILVKEPLVSKGTLFFRREPRCLVFQVREPRVAHIRLDPEVYRVYRPEQKQCERFLLESPELPNALFQAFTPDAAELAKTFSIVSHREKGGMHAIRLQPLRKEMRAVIASLTLDIAVENLQLQGIEYEDAEGDIVRIRLSRLARNPAKLDPAVFEERLPDDVKVITHRAKRRG